MELGTFLWLSAITIVLVLVFIWSISGKKKGKIIQRVRIKRKDHDNVWHVEFDKNTSIDTLLQELKHCGDKHPKVTIKSGDVIYKLIKTNREAF